MRCLLAQFHHLITLDGGVASLHNPWYESKSYKTLCSYWCLSAVLNHYLDASKKLKIFAISKTNVFVQRGNYWRPPDEHMLCIKAGNEHNKINRIKGKGSQRAGYTKAKTYHHTSLMRVVSTYRDASNKRRALI